MSQSKEDAINISALEARIADLERQLAEAGRNLLLAQDEQKEQQFKHQKELLEAIFEQSPSGIAVIAGPGLTFLMANPAYRALTPDPNFDPAGHTWKEVWPDERGLQMAALFRRVLDTGDTIHSNYHKRRFPDGTDHYYSLNLSRFRWGKEPVVLTVMWETTTLVKARNLAEQAVQEQKQLLAKVELERQRAEQLAAETHRQREFLERLVQSAPLAIAVLQGSEHRFVLSNVQGLNLPCFEGDLIGRPLAEVWPGGAQWIVPILDGVYQTGEPFYAGEVLFPVTREGEPGEAFFDVFYTPLYDELGLVEGILVMAREITDRKKTEQALRESEERFRNLANAMPQLVWTARPDGTVDYYNERYKGFNGIAPGPGETWQWAPVLHPDDRQATVEAWQHAVRTGEVYQAEHRVLMADGTIRWHLSRGVPACDAGGKVVKWYGTATDIHDQKQAEAALLVYAEKLERSNQELEQFAFIASHDLQEPLRKIQLFGNALLAKAAEKLDEGEREYLERMNNAAARMQTMVKDLLELSRVITQGQPFTQIGLNEAVDGALSDLEVQIRRTSGRVEVSELPIIQADPIQMRQLFQNLIGNALKFHKPDIPPLVKVSARQLSPTTVEIQVADNGIGFDPAKVENVFLPFQRLVGRSEYEGSGIGLAICRKISERHGGRITATSAPGEGATFRVILPVRNSPTEMAERPASTISGEGPP